MKLGTLHRRNLAMALALACLLALGSTSLPLMAAEDIPALVTDTGWGDTTGSAGPKMHYSFGSWPPDLSTHGWKLQELYDLIFIITGLTFLLTEGLLILFLFQYRARPGHKAVYTHGNMYMEVAWTLIPVVVFVTLGISNAELWARLKDRNLFPKDTFDVQVTARQFEWKIQYPGPDGRFGTDDDPDYIINELYVPYDKPVRVRLTSEDVLHSFFLPELRVKQDAVPGMMSEIWFEATRPANTEIACAELCGLGHYRMKGEVKIRSLEEVEAWIEEELSDY